MADIGYLSQDSPSTILVKAHQYLIFPCYCFVLDEHVKWIISLYRSLGEGYEANGNSRRSIENYEKAKDMLVQIGDMDGLRAVCNNMGNSYETIGVS